ncbi:MAG: hypothetical protein HKO04_02390, partial [Silicimonas sp.]|nr:hypothetical protein [Silicimonas sp.]
MEALIPLLLVAAAILAVPPAAPDKPFRSAAVVAGFSLLLGNYLWWRLTVTVLPAQGL